MKTTLQSHERAPPVFEVTIRIARHGNKYQCCTFWKRMIPRRAGWYYFCLEDTLQTKHKKGKWEAVCSQLSLVPWLGGTWPYVEARRLSLLVSVILVRIWLKLRLNSSLNPPSQCAIAYGTVRLGCDGNVAIGRTFNLKIKARFLKRGRRINTSKKIQRSEVTSITFFWWLINHDWVCVRMHLCVCITESVFVSSNKELCLWGDINSV